MNKKTKKAILKDLYATDPELQRHEEILLKNIDELLEARPEVEIDDNFKDELKKAILKKIDNDTIENSESYTPSLWEFMSPIKKIAIGGSFLTVLVLIVGMLYAGSSYNPGGAKKPASNKLAESGQLDQTDILQKEEAAFGTLGNETTTQIPTLESDMGTEKEERVALSPEPTSKTSSDGHSFKDSVLAPKNYTFKYKGSKVSINQEKSEVLKRIKQGDFADFENLIPSLQTDLANLDSFSNVRVQSLSFVEDKPFGLLINVNSNEGSVSMNQNWEMWSCEKINCPQREMLTAEDVPSDHIIISIADEFIERHDINMSNFEEGVVDNSWKRNQETLNEELFVSSTISVTYPLKIGEREVYNTMGKRVGLSVQVNIINLHVSSLHGLATRKYEASLYETEDDFAKIVQLAEKGGSLNPPVKLQENTGTEKTILTLDTPSFASAKYWHYEKGDSYELIVPVLIFPITNAIENGYFRDNIVVPLAKDMIN